MSSDAGAPGTSWTPPPERVTISDVARAAGVSVATVSKALNSRYGVSPVTARRITEVATGLGYESSLVARSLRSTRTGVLGILVAEFEPFSTELLKGVSGAVAGMGYELLAYSGSLSQGRVGWERRSLSRLAGTLIDGAVVVTPTELSPATAVPVVAVDPHTGPGGPTTVDCDNARGARTATDHLIGLGHRRIAHVRGRADLESARLREAGYREALAAAGIPSDPDLLREGDYRASPATAGAVRSLLSLPRRPTAVFAANDLSAICTVEVAQDMGLRVPQDLSVVGFDNVPEAADCAVPLTTVAQPLREMGAQAVRMLIDLLDGRGCAPHVRMPARLVVRASTGPAPTAGAAR